MRSGTADADSPSTASGLPRMKTPPGMHTTAESAGSGSQASPTPNDPESDDPGGDGAARNLVGTIVESGTPQNYKKGTGRKMDRKIRQRRGMALERACAAIAGSRRRWVGAGPTEL